MNKIAMKDLFQANDIPQVKHLVLQNITEKEKIKNLNFPLFVKPANLGSSIGVSKVHSEAELQQALEVAFHYDHQVICEQGVENLVELNCSILAYKGEIRHSFIEKIATKADFLSFEEKYLNQ